MYSIGRWNDNDERSRSFSDRNVTENGATEIKQRAKRSMLWSLCTVYSFSCNDSVNRNTKKENQPIYEVERKSTGALENDYKSIEIEIIE